VAPNQEKPHTTPLHSLIYIFYLYISEVSTDLHREIKGKRIQTPITFERQDSFSRVIGEKGLRFQENMFPLLKEKLICII
jgi:hypothetical protein